MPESTENSKPLIRTGDDGHWHFTLHPSVHNESAQNPFPAPLKRFFHPTRAILKDSEHGTEQAWTSRNHRKHRYVPYVLGNEHLRRHADNILQGVGHMFRIEYWNVSWWVAMAFTLGSIVWVVNGFASFLPEVDSAHFELAPHSAGWTAFIGATIFELGSILGMLEAWNRDDTASFGWGIEHALGREKGDMQVKRPTKGDPEMAYENTRTGKKWVWFSVKRKYFHEIAYWAALTQLFGASVFWISGFTAIPTIQNAIKENTPLLNGVFWVPQVIGGSGFITSGALIMLEAQERWWKPSFLSIGWHVGLWNHIGGIGFTMCGAFGFAAAQHSGAEYQSALSTFWGAWAFLLGSLFQWYEAVNSVS